MTHRADLRAVLRDDLMPRVAAAVQEWGFRSTGAPGAWRFERIQAGDVQAVLSADDRTGRHDRNRLVLYCDGGIVVPEVARTAAALLGDQAPALTLWAALRSFGPTYSADSSYRLDFATDPQPVIAALTADAERFAAFAASVSSVQDLTPDRLARSRIRRHVTTGLVGPTPFTTPEVAAIIAGLTSDWSTARAWAGRAVRLTPEHQAALDRWAQGPVP